MKVRIRLGKGRPVQRRAGKNRGVALAFSSLLIPAALMAYVLAAWRLTSDMGMTAEPGIPGVFSHWQVWIGVAAALHLASACLKRYGGGGMLEMPRFLMVRFLSPRAPEEPAEVPAKPRESIRTSS